MASEVVRNAFKTHLQAVKPAALPYVETSNEPADVEALPDEWVTVDYIEFGERRLTFGAPGSNLMRETGTANVRVQARPGETEAPLLGYAQVVADGFRAQVFADVVVDDVNPPATGPGFSDGAWREALVAIDYQYDRYV